MTSEHVEAPSEHAPRKETYDKGIAGILVKETDNDAAWLSADDPVTVKP